MEAIEEKVLRMYREGKKSKEIAKAINRSVTIVNQLLKPYREEELREEKLNELQAQKAYETGMTGKEVMRIFGVSKRKIQNWRHAGWDSRFKVGPHQILADKRRIIPVQVDGKQMWDVTDYFLESE